MNQVTIIRKDLGLSERQLMEYAARANEAFLLRTIGLAVESTQKKLTDADVSCTLWFGKKFFAELMDDSRARTILAANDEKHLMLALDLAKSVGMKEELHYFLFRDEKGTPVCIGFTPTDPNVTKKISMSYHSY